MRNRCTLMKGKINSSFHRKMKILKLTNDGLNCFLWKERKKNAIDGIWIWIWRVDWNIIFLFYLCRVSRGNISRKLSWFNYCAVERTCKIFSTTLISGLRVCIAVFASGHTVKKDFAYESGRRDGSKSKTAF